MLFQIMCLPKWKYNCSLALFTNPYQNCTREVNLWEVHGLIDKTSDEFCRIKPRDLMECKKQGQEQCWWWTGYENWPMVNIGKIKWSPVLRHRPGINQNEVLTYKLKQELPFFFTNTAWKLLWPIFEVTNFACEEKKSKTYRIQAMVLQLSNHRNLREFDLFKRIWPIVTWIITGEL